VRVLSDVDSTGIYLDVWELDDNTRDCYNKFADNELLYLADSTLDSPTVDDTIQVDEEEVLTFYLEVPPESGNYVESNSVKVDKGEYFQIAGSDQGAGCDNCTYAISEAKERMDSYYKWSDNGYMEGKEYSSYCSMTAGDIEYEEGKLDNIDKASTDSNCADLLIYCGHGGVGCLTACLVDSTLFCSQQYKTTWCCFNQGAGGGWADDAEWLLFSACDVLGDAGDPDGRVSLYIDELFDKKIHGILSTCDSVYFMAIDDDAYQFVEALRSSKVVTAYKDICYSGSNTQYGILVREENKDDYMDDALGNPIGRDISGKAGTYYYYYYNGNQKLFEIAGEDGITPCSIRNYEILKKAIRDCVVTGGQIQVPKLKVKHDPNDIQKVFSSTASGFDSVGITGHFFKARSDQAYEDGIHMVEIEEGTEREYVTSSGLNLPEDYELESKGKMMVNTYVVGDANSTAQLSEKWCEAEEFTFVRRYDGHKIFNDRCNVMVRNNELLKCLLTYHPIEKLGTTAVTKADFFHKENKLEAEVIYKVRGTELVPFWEVTFDRFAFHYNANEIKGTN